MAKEDTMHWIDLRIHEKVHLLRFNLEHCLALLWNGSEGGERHRQEREEERDRP
jgi:hypothetical protein